MPGHRSPSFIHPLLINHLEGIARLASNNPKQSLMIYIKWSWFDVSLGVWGEGVAELSTSDGLKVNHTHHTISLDTIHMDICYVEAIVKIE